MLYRGWGAGGKHTLLGGERDRACMNGECAVSRNILHTAPLIAGPRLQFTEHRALQQAQFPGRVPGAHGSDPASFQHGHLFSGSRQKHRSRKPREACSDNDNIAGASIKRVRADLRCGELPE